MLAPYQPGLPIEQVARQYNLDPSKIIKLASNENPLGMSPKAKKAAQAALTHSPRYPEQYDLMQALARHYGIGPSMIVLGNGSNDTLDLVARACLQPGDEAISAQYAFAIYQLVTQAAGAHNVVVPARHYGHDLAAMRAAITPRTKLIWVANPNNPTGMFVSYKEIKEWLSTIPKDVKVVIDEAYYEYLAPEDRVDTIAWLKEFPNLILVRTFSKIYGLAGLRIGYSVSSPDTAATLHTIRHPFNANVPALAAACAALQDTGFVQQSYQTNQKGKQYIIEGLQKLGLAPLPAYGNFVTFKIKNAADVNERLLRAGVIVRPLANYGMTDWLRVTVGLPAENKQFLDVLRTVVS